LFVLDDNELMDQHSSPVLNNIFHAKNIYNMCILRRRARVLASFLPSRWPVRLQCVLVTTTFWISWWHLFFLSFAASLEVPPLLEVSPPFGSVALGDSPPPLPTPRCATVNLMLRTIIDWKAISITYDKCQLEMPLCK